jgi:hypothetical protein
MWVFFHAGLFNLYLRKINMGLKIRCRGLQDSFLPLLISLICRWPPPYHRSTTTTYGAPLVRLATAVRAHPWGVIRHAVIFIYNNLVIAVVAIVVGGFHSIKAIV